MYIVCSRFVFLHTAFFPLRRCRGRACGISLRRRSLQVDGGPLSGIRGRFPAPCTSQFKYSRGRSGTSGSAEGTGNVLFVSLQSLSVDQIHH